MRESFEVFGALIAAALLEVGGDALVRYGLRGANSIAARIAGFALGAIVLFVYSLSINTPKWDFGRLLGTYIALFFVVSQTMAVVLFKESLKPPTLVAGLLIIAGGAVLTLWQPK